MENKEYFYFNHKNPNLKISNSTENIEIFNSRSSLKSKQENFNSKNSLLKRTKHSSIERNNSNPNLPQLVTPSNFLEEMYIKYSKSLQTYFLQNREGMKLQGNKYFQNISIDQFIKERPTTTRKYLNILKNSKNQNSQEKIILNYQNLNNNNIGNKINGEDFFLTPLPNKSRKLLNTKKEKSDFLFAERAAVMMRTFEYTHGVRSNVGINELQKIMEEQKQKLINIMVDAVYKIQNWWKKVKVNKKKKDIILRNKENEKYYQKMSEYQKVLNKKKLKICIEKLFNYCLKKTFKIKKYAFKKLIKFSQYQIKKIYYLYDWVRNIQICKGRRFEISASYMKIIKRDNFLIFKNDNFERNYFFSKLKINNKKQNPFSKNQQLNQIILLQKFIKKFLHYKKIKDLANKIQKEISIDSFSLINNSSQDVNFIKFLNGNKKWKSNPYTKRNYSFEKIDDIDDDNDSVITYNENNNIINNPEFRFLDLNEKAQNVLNIQKNKKLKSEIDDKVKNNINNSIIDNNENILKYPSSKLSDKKNINSKINVNKSSIDLLKNKCSSISLSSNSKTDEIENIKNKNNTSLIINQLNNTPSKNINNRNNINKKLLFNNNNSNINSNQKKEKENLNSSLPKSNVNKFVSDVPKSGKHQRTSSLINKNVINRRNSLNNNIMGSFSKNSLKEEDTKQNKTSVENNNINSLSKRSESKLILYENENDVNINDDKKINNNIQNIINKKEKDIKNKNKEMIKTIKDSEKIVNSIIENKKKEIDEINNMNNNNNYSNNNSIIKDKSNNFQISQMIQKYPNLNRNLFKNNYEIYPENEIKLNKNKDNLIKENSSDKKTNEVTKTNSLKRNSSSKSIPHPHLKKNSINYLHKKNQSIDIPNSKLNDNNQSSLESLFPGLTLYTSIFNFIQKPFPNHICYISKNNFKINGSQIVLFLKNILKIKERKISNEENNKYNLKEYFIKWKNIVQNYYNISIYELIKKPFPNHICYINKINTKINGNQIISSLKNILDIKDRKINNEKYYKYNLKEFFIKWKNIVQNYYKIPIYELIKKPFPNQICFINKNYKTIDYNKIISYIKKIFDIKEKITFKKKYNKYYTKDYFFKWRNNIQKVFKLKCSIIKYNYIINLRKYLKKWKKLIIKISNLELIIIKLNNKKSLNKYFENWKSNNIKFSKLKKIIPKFLNKNDKNLLKEYLNKWNQIIILETQKPYIYSQNIRSISSGPKNQNSQHFSYYCKINKSNNENDYLTIRMSLGYKLLLKVFSKGILHIFLIKLKNIKRRKKRAKTNVYNRRNTKVHLEILNMNLKLFHCLHSIIKKKFYSIFYHRLLYISLNLNNNIEYELEKNNKCNLIREGYKKGYFQILNNILTIRFNYIYIDTGLKFQDFVKKILND